MLYQKLNPEFSYIDNRGSLTQLVHEGYTQINVVISEAGVLRGNHYHKQSTEAFYVVNGAVVVSLSRESQKEKVTFRCGDFFQIEPYTLHSMYYPEDTILVVLYDKPVERENGEKDIVQQDGE